MICLSFDNLGEAAELELGAKEEEVPIGRHPSVTEALPRVLELLASHDLRATFFIEGVNAETYPDALRRIADAGHEVGYHAWRHEQWANLSPEEERSNLERGVEAFDSIGIRPIGFRPPGGGVSDQTFGILRELGFEYCSPEGTEFRREEVAVLPFEWRHVDFFHLVMEGNGPDAVEREFLAAEDAVLVMHPWLLEMETEVVERVLENGGVTCEEAVREWAT